MKIIGATIKLSTPEIVVMNLFWFFMPHCICKEPNGRTTIKICETQSKTWSHCSTWEPSISTTWGRHEDGSMWVTTSVVLITGRFRTMEQLNFGRFLVKQAVGAPKLKKDFLCVVCLVRCFGSSFVQPPPEPNPTCGLALKESRHPALGFFQVVYRAACTFLVSKWIQT